MESNRIAAGLVVSYVLLFAQAVAPQEKRICEHELLGLPSRREFMIHREGYDVLVDGVRKVPLWTQYRTNPGCMAVNVTERTSFRADSEVPEVCRARLFDYESGPFDRGHLVPFADMRRNASVARESMLLSNIAPQDPKVNRGPWRMIEDRVREWISKSTDGVVVTGTIWGDDLEELGSGVVVPDGMFKVVALEHQFEWRVIVFAARCGDGDKEPGELVANLRDIEKITGFEMLPKLEPGFRYSELSFDEMSRWFE